MMSVCEPVCPMSNSKYETLFLDMIQDMKMFYSIVELACWMQPWLVTSFCAIVKRYFSRFHSISVFPIYDIPNAFYLKILPFIKIDLIHILFCDNEMNDNVEFLTPEAIIVSCVWSDYLLSTINLLFIVSILLMLNLILISIQCCNL